MLSPADELAFESAASPFYSQSFVSPSALVQTQTVDAPPPPPVRRTTRSSNKKRHLDSDNDSDSDNEDNGSDYAPPSSKKRKTQSGPPPSSAPSIDPPIFIMDHPGQKGYGSPAYASTLRPPRGKALLPTPIPNLTKKSRGRRVPTADDDPHDKRMYACPAVGCGKCFHRGEHLKRHIRSIHTNDKPFRCEERNCGKYFNRHDNLLQHLKVHSLTDSGQLPMPISRPSKRKDSLPSPLSLDTGLQLYNALAYQPSLQASSSNTDRSASPSTSSQVSHAELAVSATRTELPSGEVPLDAPTLPDDVSSEQQHQHHHQQFPPFYPPQFDWHQHPPYFSSDVAHTVPHPQSLDEQLWN